MRLFPFSAYLAGVAASEFPFPTSGQIILQPECDGIEIVDNQQAVIPKSAQQAMVSAESGIHCFIVIHIIGKIQISNITFQVAGVGEIDNVGVFSAVSFGIGFRQFTFANIGNALKEHFSLRA